MKLIPTLALAGLAQAAWPLTGQCDGKGDNVSNGSEFDQAEKPFTWISNRMTKMKLQGTTMKKLQVNINGIKNGKNKDYLGFMIFPKSLMEKISLQRLWTAL